MTSEQRKTRLRKVLVWSVTGGAALLLLVASLRIIYIYNYELPDLDRLYDIEPSLSTKVYARDGTLIKKFYREQRNLIPFNQIPPAMVNALLSTEDRNFYNHWGVSSRALARAVVKNFLRGFGAQGASTITQQLARMLFWNRSLTLDRKVKEALTAIKLERLYSKNEILEMYLNLYNFGNRSYGLEEAARNYFNKPVERLKIEECAMLAGVIKAPGRYSPITQPERALQRRNYVLDNMVRCGKLTRAVADSLKKRPIRLDLSNQSGEVGDYFTEYLRQYLANKYGDSAVYSGGMSVYTTLEPLVQRAAEDAVRDQTAALQQQIENRYRYNNPDYTLQVVDEQTGKTSYQYKQIEGACVVIDNLTGDILAMVGGREFDRSEFNRAVQAKRQPGSAFKPFVYTAAIDNGYRPCDEMWDSPVVYTIPGYKEWRPHNFDDKFMGKMPLREGFYRSRNLVAIKLLNMVSPQQAIFYARKMGINSRLSPDLSLAIGTSEVTLLELASAYTVFPNGGVKVKPRFLYRVVDRYGTILEQNPVAEREEVLTAQTAYIMVDMMRSVLDNPNGTARTARALGFLREAAGKTGTTDSFCDDWFVGYTPQVTCGVWLGFDDKTSLGHNQTGAVNALPIWTKVMLAAHEDIPADVPEAHFAVPPGIIFAYVCYDSGELATDKCVNVGREVFTQKTLPKSFCHKHPSTGVYASPDGDHFNLSRPDTTRGGVQNW